ncbi:MAG: hypothetical protein ACRDFC_01380 [Ignavibacteria bacterium]
MSKTSNNIVLSVLSYYENGNYYSICLDTNIIVRGKTIEESIQKMKDALTVYMRSFTKDEIESEQYIRKAPFKYKLKMWSLILAIIFKSFKGSISSAEFDSSSQNLSFA